MYQHANSVGANSLARVVNSALAFVCVPPPGSRPPAVMRRDVSQDVTQGSAERDTGSAVREAKEAAIKADNAALSSPSPWLLPHRFGPHQPKYLTPM